MLASLLPLVVAHHYVLGRFVVVQLRLQVRRQLLLRVLVVFVVEGDLLVAVGVVHQVLRIRNL